MNELSRKVAGVGTNDIIGSIGTKAYKAWANMLGRCYYKKCLDRKPSYNGCSVCDDWLMFSNYKKWYDSHHIEGWHCDKDIIVPNNKIYSPETCVYVPPSINATFAGNTRASKSINGLLMGVYKHGNRFRVNYYVNGVNAYKFFSSECEAHHFYCQKRLLRIADLYEFEIDDVYSEAANEALANGNTELAKNIVSSREKLLKRMEDIICNAGIDCLNDQVITDLYA